jgi:phosphatidyl-myo-inositol dimannoside synthase
LRLAFLSSTPASPKEGSGTFVALDGLARGLARLGHEVVFRRLSVRTRFHTLDRWVYNVGAALAPPVADVVVGIDLDGFLWARRRPPRRGGAAGPPTPDRRAIPPRTPFVVALKGVIADELTNERGVVRALLAVQARWERSNCARADRVVVPSRYSAGVAGAAYGIPAERLAVVPEPIDLAAWRRLFAEARAGRAARPTVLAVARMYPRKRLHDLLEAAAALRGRIPDLEVRIVGAGPESARLRALHARLGLGDRVVFLGEVSRSTLAVEYTRAHCFCLPTVQEGFGLVFTEAMAAGLPVVACRAAAVPEVVAEGRTGLLVEPRSPQALAAALERLLTDDALRTRMGEEGMRHVETYDLERVAGRFLEAVPA